MVLLQENFLLNSPWKSLPVLTGRFKIQNNYRIDFYTFLCSVTSFELEERCSSLMISPHSNLPNQFPFHFEGGHQITFPLAMCFNSNDIKILYPITSVGSSAYPISFALWVFQILYHFQMHLTLPGNY